MKALLDTHVWLWSLCAPERLCETARAAISDPANEVYLSAASAWEMAIKFALGKLPLPEPPGEYVPARMKTQGISPLLVSHAHALRVASLPPHHSDPFDRLLIAQAQAEGLMLLTADPQFKPYAVRLLWAAAP
ncbi:MAG: type II toxin-antitoxin system VapC family toxin [Myxococcota bacterium]